MLVKLLTGVFDPPPERLSVPWFFLAFQVAVAVLSVVIAVIAAFRETRVPAVQRMRERWHERRMHARRLASSGRPQRNAVELQSFRCQFYKGGS
jgi:hypothetical protein